MGRNKHEVKFTCGSCRRKIFLTDGKSLNKRNSIVCPHCGSKNKVVRKKNGKTKLCCD